MVRYTKSRSNDKTDVSYSKSASNGHGYHVQKGSHEEILAAFANHDADILVGTQMIVKGHDFPNVTLVGVLAADVLYASDYKAAERTFALLALRHGDSWQRKCKGRCGYSDIQS